jgi:hypothetical protein
MLPGVFWLLMLVEAPMLALHVLVLLILILQMFKRDLTLSPGFSLLFAVQVAVEIILYVDVGYRRFTPRQHISCINNIYFKGKTCPAFSFSSSHAFRKQAFCRRMLSQTL